MKLKTCVGSVVMFIAAGTVAASDWPRWLGPSGNGISRETGLAEAWPAEGPRKVWSKPVGIGFASPVALDGRIYLFYEEENKDTLRAMDAETGNVLWTQSYDRAKTYAFPGTRATPTIENGRIYTHGSNGDLVCRDLADGKLVWQTNSLTETGGGPIEWGQASSPFIVDDLIYVQGGKGGATALAVNRNTGKVAWKSEATGLAGYATAILIEVEGKKQLVIFGGDSVYGMDHTTGKTLWTESWKTDYDVNAATPVYRAPHLLVTSTRNPGSTMLSVTAQGVKKEWEKKIPSSKFQPPILDGDTLYANNNGALVAITWPAGEVAWTARGRELNLGAGGSMLRVGDKLITLSERGRLNIVQADAKQFKLLSGFELFDYDKVWSMPIVYRGKLYAKGKDELVCLDVSAPQQ